MDLAVTQRAVIFGPQGTAFGDFFFETNENANQTLWDSLASRTPICRPARQQIYSVTRCPGGALQRVGTSIPWSLYVTATHQYNVITPSHPHKEIGRSVCRTCVLIPLLLRRLCMYSGKLQIMYMNSEHGVNMLHRVLKKIKPRLDNPLRSCPHQQCLQPRSWRPQQRQ